MQSILSFLVCDTPLKLSHRVCSPELSQDMSGLHLLYPQTGGHVALKYTVDAILVPRTGKDTVHTVYVKTVRPRSTCAQYRYAKLMNSSISSKTKSLMGSLIVILSKIFIRSK